MKIFLLISAVFFSSSISFSSCNIEFNPNDTYYQRSMTCFGDGLSHLGWGTTQVIAAGGLNYLLSESVNPVESATAVHSKTLDNRIAYYYDPKDVRMISLAEFQNIKAEVQQGPSTEALFLSGLLVVGSWNIVKGGFKIIEGMGYLGVASFKELKDYSKREKIKKT